MHQNYTLWASLSKGNNWKWQRLQSKTKQNKARRDPNRTVAKCVLYKAECVLVMTLRTQIHQRLWAIGYLKSEALQREAKAMNGVLRT